MPIKFQTPLIQFHFPHHLIYQHYIISLMNYNEKLRSIRIRDAIVFLIVGMIVTGIITRVTSLDPIQGFGENLLIFIVFLGFIYMLRGTTGFTDSIGSAFEHKNEIIYLFVINFLFGFSWLLLSRFLIPADLIPLRFQESILVWVFYSMYCLQ